MKKFSLLILLTLVLVACGTDGHHFEVEGKLINLNQGEFYIYSPDNVINGIDTIKVLGGRFSYEIPCEKEGVLVVVFPNFSEQPIFAQPGKSVDIKGDASHLKKLEITGTDDNELMTKFRHQIANMSPPEIEKHVSLFISDHLESIVGPYIVDKFLLRKQNSNYKQACQLLASMQKEQPRNGYLNRLLAQCKPLADASGNRLPAFKATDINGKSISSATLSLAPVAVVYTWATWSYESTSLQQRLLNLRSRAEGKLQLLGISLEPSLAGCKENVSEQSAGWSVVCDEQLFEGALIRKLGLTAVPDNILLQHGRVVARGLSTDDLISRLEKLI